MKRLRELMIENELTYQKLSDQLKERNINVTPDALRKWAVGTRKPNVYKALDLASFFNVSIDYLVGRSDKRMKEERTTVLATGLINEAYCQRTVTYNGKEFEILVDSTGSVVTDPTKITRLCNNGIALKEYTETGEIPEWYKLGE